MNRLYLIIIIASIFIAGWFSGKGVSDNHWHKLTEDQLRQYNQELIKKNQMNNILAESYGNLDIKYQMALKDKQNVLEKNRELINANNRITKQLVCYIQDNSSGAVMQKSHPESAIDTDATVPAIDFGIWASGLVTHDQQCVNQLNTLIKAINNVN